MRTYYKILLFLRRQPRYINWFIKLAIALLFGLLLWYDIFAREDFQEIKNLFLRNSKAKTGIGWSLA